MFTGIPAAAQPGGRPVSWGLRLLIVVGVVAIAIAWSEASNTVQVSQQVDWAPLALAGVAAITGALLGSVLVARMAVAIRVHRLAPFITRSGESPEAVARAGAAAAAVPSAGVADGPESLVAGANMARYHRASCPLAAGKPVRPESRRAHEDAGRQACGVCAP